MCGEFLVARHCQERVWHWAHRPHTNQKEGTCLFDDSEWALRWRLGYLMFDGWKIEVPKKLPSGKTILLHAVRPVTRRMIELGEKGKVREFVGHINDANNDRFNFLLNSQNHEVVWMIDGTQWVRALAKQVGNGERVGYKDFLKPKAQTLYSSICVAGQNALVHVHDVKGGTLYREWVKPAANADQPVEHTGIWYPCEGERALAVLDNYSKVTLPYDNAKSENLKASKAGQFDKLLEAV